jgi:lipopolysaccharide/colanic/teichoic acid biosynthesis glycosyltransferase
MLRGPRFAQANPCALIPRAPLNAGERACALVLLILCAPLIALIALYIRLTDGGPVFYRGVRLGQGMRPFRMLKLRTLRNGADAVTGGDLLTHRHQLAIRGGLFLRDTRLDELPQLLNIVLGHMSFVGPRPERPEVRAAMCSGIPGYEERFKVRPGLIGISQLFTPHGTPKRYRTLIDNGVIRGEGWASKRLRIVAFTAWAVLCEVGRRTLGQLARLWARLSRRYQEQRRLRRASPRGAVAHIRWPDSPRARTARLLDMNEEALLVECEYEPGVEKETELVLEVPLPGRTRPARRTARCSGRVCERRLGPSSVQLLIQYEPSSPRSEYIVHQYFLRDSLAVPRPAWKGPTPPFLPPAQGAPERPVRQKVSIG